MSEFTSCLSPLIESFIAYRKASENWNEVSYKVMLLLFDRYCAKFYPAANDLLQEMVDGWCKQRDTENNNSCRSRIYVVDRMIRYLRSRGKTNVNPPILPRKERRTYIPHAFTEVELTNFFNACDSLPYAASRQERSRKIIVPVFFRLLYSSGIRTNEARMLRAADVDLHHGILDIQYSKGHDQHYVALHDSMLALLRQYDDAIKKIYPDRVYFFPAVNGKYHRAQWVQSNFRQLWDGINDTHAVPYEFRHHYAVSNINSWVDEGFGFDAKLLYLSKSMGHRGVESTKYYYSLVPGLADILEEKTNTDFENIVPEAYYEESK